MEAPKNNNIRRFSSRSASENLAPGNMYGGIFPFPPPSLSFSYPPSASGLNLISRPHRQQNHPPLLPLPLPISRSSSSLSSRSSYTTRKANNNRARDQSVTPKKPKSKKEAAKPKSESLVVASTNRLGPDPNDLSRDVGPKVILSSSSLGPGCVVLGDLDKFSGGSVCSLSPPPSSLPLPGFLILRPSKLSCNAEAAGIDAGATDNLRRLLRLR
ncbi:hypothetical protein TIFTF001_005539 [Ficus carica]|uniref:Uncharacterized protein n=1 Tax=Ficus carica TaxID=3494 RepID=A0AA87ZM80_FICCA|nr:hypothetical protein TIFTF001_005539 [Ficus carica]